MCEIVLDTESTGLFAENGDRIIEIGCVALLGRKLTGNNKHFYLNPERAATKTRSRFTASAMSF